jgi:hypothetical protein
MIFVLDLCLTDFKRTAIYIGFNRGNVKYGDRHLGVRRLRAQLIVRVAHALAHGVDADEGTRRQEILALEGPASHRVLLRPYTVLVLRQEFARHQLVTRIAALRSLRIPKRRRALIATQLAGGYSDIRVIHNSATNRLAAATGEIRGLVAISGR